MGYSWSSICQRPKKDRESMLGNIVLWLNGSSIKKQRKERRTQGCTLCSFLSRGSTVPLVLSHDKAEEIFSNMHHSSCSTLFRAMFEINPAVLRAGARFHVLGSGDR